MQARGRALARSLVRRARGARPACAFGRTGSTPLACAPAWNERRQPRLRSPVPAARSAPLLARELTSEPRRPGETKATVAERSAGPRQLARSVRARRSSVQNERSIYAGHAGWPHYASSSHGEVVTAPRQERPSRRAGRRGCCRRKGEARQAPCQARVAWRVEACSTFVEDFRLDCVCCSLVGRWLKARTFRADVWPMTRSLRGYVHDRLCARFAGKDRS
jgi:hypothetical protein